jgi:hypothetical protein
MKTKTKPLAPENCQAATATQIEPNSIRVKIKIVEANMLRKQTFSATWAKHIKKFDNCRKGVRCEWVVPMEKV